MANKHPSAQIIQRALTERDGKILADHLGRPELNLDPLWQALDSLLSPAQARELLSAALTTIDPERAVNRLLDLCSSPLPPIQRWNTLGRRALAFGLAYSDAISRYVTVQPAIAIPIVSGRFLRQAKPFSVMRDELRALRASSRNDQILQERLKSYRIREWVRIVLRDLMRLGSVADVLEELSDLAESIVDCAVRFHLRRDRGEKGSRSEAFPGGAREAGFTVIALGKLGGRELNVSSDIDLQFVYSSDDGIEGAPLTLHQRFTRVAQRVVKTLGGSGGVTMCYRVDTDLRPEGKKGPLVNSVLASERYYENWGKNWERLALIRARPIAGSAWTWREFERSIRPFVFPRTFAVGLVDEIRTLKEQMFVERKARSYRRGQKLGFDLKRDPGGIREIELFVQILQLLHGGQNPSLKNGRLLDAIEHLHYSGVLGTVDRHQLRGSYSLFRRTENAIQAREDRQTHQLPDSTSEAGRALQALLARPRSSITKKLSTRRESVMKITGRLFGSSSDPVVEQAVAALACTGEAQLRALRELEFGFPDEAMGILAALRKQSQGPFSHRASATERRVAAQLLVEMAHSPDPDQALRLWPELDRSWRRFRFGQLLRVEPVRRQVMELLGSSEYLSTSLIRYPELVEWLAQGRDTLTQQRRRGVKKVKQEILDRFRNSLKPHADTEQKLRVLKRLKMREQLRIGTLDLAGLMPVPEVLTQLCDVAEACLQVTDLLACEQAHIRDPQRSFVVLGLGRLGGGEMGYGSDLDLIFVYDESANPEGTSARDHAVRRAQSLIRLLSYSLPEGRLYSIDTRLRPSGNQGPLVTGASGFEDYHRTRAELWEKQALLSARPLAGDLDFGRRVLGGLTDVIYPPSMPSDARATIHRMRQRMEKEIAQEGPNFFNLKTGSGGLVDIEFITEYLRLAHACRIPSLRVRNVPTAIEALTDQDLLSKPDGKALTSGYQFLRFLENRLRIVHNRPIGRFEIGGPSWKVLARRMGYRGQRASLQLERDYARVRQSVRRVYDRIFLASAE